MRDVRTRIRVTIPACLLVACGSPFTEVSSDGAPPQDVPSSDTGTTDTGTTETGSVDSMPPPSDAAGTFPCGSLKNVVQCENGAQFCGTGPSGGTPVCFPTPKTCLGARKCDCDKASAETAQKTFCTCSGVEGSGQYTVQCKLPTADASAPDGGSGGGTSDGGKVDAGHVTKDGGLLRDVMLLDRML